METLVHNGEQYTKASVLAKRFRYTSDYIGQLCRSGKVDAKLVGRSWFVSEASLLAHKDTRYLALRADEKTRNIPFFSETQTVENVISVVPRLSKKTARIILAQSTADNLPTPKKMAIYSTDDTDLVPTSPERHVVTKPQEIRVELSDSTRIPIKISEKGVNRLTFSQLPEVPLRGMLKISSLDESMTESWSEPVEYKKPVVVVLSKEVEVSKQKLVSPLSVVPTAKIANTLPNFTPLRIKQAKTTTATFSSFKLVASTFVMASVAFLLLVTLTTQIVSDGVSSKVTVGFNTASLIELVSFFK